MLPMEFLGKSPCLWKAQPPHKAKPQDWTFQMLAGASPGHAPLPGQPQQLGQGRPQTLWPVKTFSVYTQVYMSH